MAASHDDGECGKDQRSEVRQPAANRSVVEFRTARELALNQNVHQREERKGYDDHGDLPCDIFAQRRSRIAQRYRGTKRA